MSISLEAPVITAKSERHSSLSPAQIMEIARAREASLSRLLMAYISSGLVFMLLPGTFLGVWNLLQISGRESARVHFACMVTGSRPCTGVRLDRKLYFGHWFLLGSEATRRNEASASVRPGHAGQCGQSVWRYAGPQMFTRGNGVCCFRSRASSNWLRS